MSPLRLRADPHLQVQDNGKVLIGGSPTKAMRLSVKGAEMVRTWFAGNPVDDNNDAASDLANRLISAGMAHPEPPSSDVTFSVVIPVRDDHEGLSATKACLAQDPRLQVIVVEDSQPVAMGPAAARNLGAKTCETDVIVFVDAGVELDVASLKRLVNHLGQPGTVAVAPRVMSQPGPGAIAAYELEKSPLDLGAAPGAVAPGLRISYVPSTVLAVRTDTFRAAGGFDPNLRYGEDVDLIWRLGQIGDVRYDPSVIATHPPRADLGAFVRQRYNYGASAGALGALHGSAVAPVALSPWSVATIGLAMIPLPRALVLWVGALAVALSRKLPGSAPVANAVNISISGHIAAAESIARASTRAWWPLSLLALGTPLRSRVLALNLWSWVTHRSVLGLLDDLAYGAGLWRGTLRARSARSVLPRFNNQSNRSNN